MRNHGRIKEGCSPFSMALEVIPREGRQHSRSPTLCRSKEELNRVSEEVGDRGEMYLVLLIAIGAAIEEKRCGLWIGDHACLHAAVLYQKMAVSMPKLIMKREVKLPVRQHGASSLLELGSPYFQESGDAFCGHSIPHPIRSTFGYWLLIFHWWEISRMALAAISICSRVLK